MREKVVLSVLILLFTFGCSSIPKQPRNNSLFAHLTGVWDEQVMGGEFCAKNDYKFMFDIVEDGEYLVFRKFKATKLTTGAISDTLVYKIIYSENNSLVLFMLNENRRNFAGDKILWELIFDSPTEFSWRIYGSNPNWRTVVKGKKCSESPGREFDSFASIKHGQKNINDLPEDLKEKFHKKAVERYLEEQKKKEKALKGEEF